MTLPLMLFAAGFGTRMGALTKTQPKPLIPVAGQPLIDRALDLAEAAGATPIVVNTHYLADQLHDHLRDRAVIVSHEADQILETGGGLRAALPLLGSDTVLTLNPDVIWIGENPLLQLLSQWDPTRMDALLACIPLARTYGRGGKGDFTVNTHGQITRGNDIAYGGAQIIKTTRLTEIAGQSFSINALWDLQMQEGRLFAALYPGEWCDVGRPEMISLAETLVGATDV